MSTSQNWRRAAESDPGEASQSAGPICQGQLTHQVANKARAMKLYIVASIATASAWVAPRSAAPRGLSVRAPPASPRPFFPASSV